MLDFNTSENTMTASLRIELAEDYELTDETFAVFCNQQGDILPALRSSSEEFLQTPLKITVRDEQNIVFS